MPRRRRPSMRRRPDSGLVGRWRRSVTLSRRKWRGNKSSCCGRGPRSQCRRLMWIGAQSRRKRLLRCGILGRSDRLCTRTPLAIYLPVRDSSRQSRGGSGFRRRRILAPGGGRSSQHRNGKGFRPVVGDPPDVVRPSRAREIDLLPVAPVREDAVAPRPRPAIAVVAVAAEDVNGRVPREGGCRRRRLPLRREAVRERCARPVLPVHEPLEEVHVLLAQPAHHVVERGRIHREAASPAAAPVAVVPPRPRRGRRRRRRRRVGRRRHRSAAVALEPGELGRRRSAGAGAGAGVA
jgi:hypothetical protein